ncbi:MAG: type I restriction enzyme HsdR N-terminal domain-containing protein [Zoogloeaceae bacterium]|jgi:hypothetical protein|nr:type I restriction enzyme HsdR N-terminal domain-containing protein [Zoogloeaceae bacterium]
MQNFIDRMRRHAEHVANVGSHCTTEETTKQALILPLLDILGFSPFDPTRVKAEYGADFPGVKANERVDYALFCHDVPVMFIEAKAWAEKLSNHAPQLSRYFNATPEVAIAAITNGQEWRFFTDLHNKNVMDTAPFLTVDFTALDESQINRLYRFRHDEFQPDALRMLAEESIYLNAFTEVIGNSLREPDTEFVRYVATRANVQRQFNARFLESITPIVQQAVSRAVSNMVVTGLSAKPVPSPAEAPPPVAAIDPKAGWIDPDNARIVTTYAERRLLEITQGILGEGAEVVGKDTESYYAVLFQGKVNRWLIRFYGDKKIPVIQVCVPLDDARKREVTRAGLEISSGDTIVLHHPEDLMRISGIVFDTLAYCQNDENFKRGAGQSAQ